MKRSGRDPGDLAREQLRRVNHVDALLLLLGLLLLVVFRGDILDVGTYLGVLGVYGIVILLLRYTPIVPVPDRMKLFIQCLVMTLFVTILLLQIDPSQGRLLNLFLLPLVTSAITLRRKDTLIVLCAAVAGRLMVGYHHGELGWSAGFARQLLMEASPVLLILFMVSAFSTDLQKYGRQMRRLSDQDGLTGFANIISFMRMVGEQHRMADMARTSYALMMVDIDGLKVINDRHGFEEGNRVMLAVADAVKRSTRHRDVIARFGGDEFAVFLDGANDEVAAAVANRLRHNVFSSHIEIGNRAEKITVSVGSAVFPDDATDVDGLIRRADQNMYRDKEFRRARRRGDAPGGAAEPQDAPVQAASD